MTPPAGPICPPDLSSRPLAFEVERTLSVPADRIYLAWTERIDSWFAAPGTVLMRPEVNAPFFFETVHDPADGLPPLRHPHYGRFLRLESPRLIEMTLVTGPDGTRGAETVLSLHLSPLGPSTTHLRLTHHGFPDPSSLDRHSLAWPFVLDLLDQRLRSAS